MAIATPLPLPIETVTPIKPSEYLRLGSLTMPQAFGTTLVFNESHTAALAACAWGTIMSGAGFASDESVRVSRLMSSVFATCPAPRCRNHLTQGTVSNVIINLNDEHYWSRGRIADWLEEIGL